MIVLHTVVTDTFNPGLKKREWNKITRENMRETAEEWHENIMPRHFLPGNKNRYPIEPRNPIYERFIKPKVGQGAGRTLALILSGESRRRAMHLYRVTATRSKAVVYMDMPAYFVRPKVGPRRDERGRLKTSRRQPDKAAELTHVNPQDKAHLVRFSHGRYAVALNEQKRTRESIG